MPHLYIHSSFIHLFVHPSIYIHTSIRPSIIHSSTMHPSIIYPCIHYPSIHSSSIHHLFVHPSPIHPVIQHSPDACFIPFLSLSTFVLISPSLALFCVSLSSLESHPFPVFPPLLLPTALLLSNPAYRLLLATYARPPRGPGPPTPAWAKPTNTQGKPLCP